MKFAILISFVLLLLTINPLFSQQFTDIQLPEPIKTGGMPLMEALNQRQTIREFSEKEFSLQEISNILWAAFGVNRSDAGKRTAPSARNLQEVDIYVSTKEGIYLYDAFENTLIAIKSGDFRKKMGIQNFVSDAPLVMIFVADYSKLKGKLPDNRKAFYTGTSAGYISQNVYLYAASEGLATVVLGAILHDKISKAIGLEEHQVVLLSQPIGFIKE
jgi:SagB-type dehydrogenase family enzyme